ncbi:hypothetical protein ACFLZW_05990 [Chloroflexota bacterium]
MRRSQLYFFCALILTGCGRFDSLLYTPRQTPQTWLSIQPFMQFQIGSSTIFLVQPTTTLIVYLLGILTIVFGLYFIKIQDNQSSRRWWGIALLFWGIGALLAGTSYEAFSYQIKCAGREFCVWTSWWEIIYLIFSAASVDAMMAAQAYSCATGKLRAALLCYAILNFTLYTIAVLMGAFIPLQFLISFELLILVCAPTILVFFFLNGMRYYKLRGSKDLVLLRTWIWLALTIGAYFLYLISGLTQNLWAHGIWFSENDVLHIGLILWMIYIAVIVIRRVEDEPLPN